MDTDTCKHWTNGEYCGSTVGVKLYLPGPVCPLHTPNALAGLPETVPDPERTLPGLLRAHGLDYTHSLTPSSETAVDARARASGKRRSNPGDYRAAQAAVRTRATEGARDGVTVHAFDYARLNGQAKRVFDVARDGQWRTLAELAEATGDPATSCQSRMRDFRKDKFGGLRAEAEVIEGSNVWRYRLILPTDVQMLLPA